MGPIWTVFDHIESKSNLVCNVDPAFSNMFDGDFEEIHFKAPSVVSCEHLTDFKRRFVASVTTLNKQDTSFLLFLPVGLEQLHATLVSGRGYQDGPVGRQRSAATQWMRHEAEFTAAAVLGPQWRGSLHRQACDRHG